MSARARLLAVVATALVGALGVISSTQTWLTVTLADGADHRLPVAGAAAVPVLAPLCLAVLALGGALSIVGVVLRHVFGALTVLIAAALAVVTAPVAFTLPPAAVASTVTTATGITGAGAVAGLVQSITPTPWPVITVLLSALLLAVGVFVLVTARRWRGSGRRYEAEDATVAPTRPRDAVDSWDDLSRGTDPTG